MIPTSLPSKVRPGADVEASTINKLIDAIQANTVNSFVGGSVERSTNGTTLKVKKNRTSPQSILSATHPFEVVISESVTTPGEYVSKLATTASYLFEDLDPSNTITIDNIASGFPLLSSGEDKVWLKGTVTTFPEVASVAIESLGNGDTFDGGVVEHDGATAAEQDYFRKVLAIVNCDTTVPEKSRQYVRDHLTLTNLAYDKARESSGTTASEKLIACVFPTVI